MYKFRPLYFSLFIILLAMFLCACNSEQKNDSKVEVLRIFNSHDYIDDGLDDDGKVVGTNILDDWVDDYYNRTGKKVTYIYEMFETNENMYNILKTGKSQFDLINTSDYMIQKMIMQNMLIKFDMEKDGKTYSYVPNYNLYGSNYIKDLYLDYGFTEYTIPYMWGTMGFVYDPEAVCEDDMYTWDNLWDSKYHNLSTVKNSVRDTYVAGVMHVYKDELIELQAKYKDNLLTQSEYNKQLQDIMNRCDDETILLVQDALLELRKNIFGFEVDNGKTDIVTGKIAINMAWSGDAVYSMNQAEEDANMFLKYAVPLEGSNVWFDTWAMPVGANKELAQDFVNYISSPESAVRNMDKVGYTSAIAGDAVYEYMCDNYLDTEGSEIVDLTYFYDGTLSDYNLTNGKALITVSERGRQLDCQYPEYDVIIRCGIMQDFGSQNDAVLNMWEIVKSGSSTLLLWLPIIIVVVAGISLYVYREIDKRNRKKRHMKLTNKIN